MDSANDPAIGRAFPLRDQVPSRLCLGGMTDELITGMTVNLLRRHFTVWKNLEDPYLQKEDFAWKKGEDRGVLIDALEDWEPGAASHRPALLIRLNDVDDERIAIGDKVSEDDQGNAAYTTLCVGSNTVVCLAGNAREAKALASEVRRQLRWFGNPISRVARLVRWRVLKKGQAVQVQESTDNWMVPVTVGWAYTESWTLTQVARPLRRVENDIRFE